MVVELITSNYSLFLLNQQKLKSGSIRRIPDNTAEFQNSGTGKLVYNKEQIHSPLLDYH